MSLNNPHGLLHCSPILLFEGIVGLKDPLREGVVEAIHRMQDSGAKVREWVEGRCCNSTVQYSNRVKITIMTKIRITSQHMLLLPLTVCCSVLTYRTIPYVHR